MRVTLTQVAAQQFENMPLVAKRRILTVFERLTQWPEVSGAKPLRGRWFGSYRMRTGDWRVIFELRADALVITKVGHRNGFYEDRR